MTRSLAVALNALGLYAIALVLAAAFAAQLLLGELPCPLCLLQRIQFALLAIGPILNVRFSNRPFGVKRFQTIHQLQCRCRSRARASLRNRHQGPSIMGFEDEAEQSLGRPCRQM